MLLGTWKHLWKLLILKYLKEKCDLCTIGFRFSSCKATCKWEGVFWTTTVWKRLSIVGTWLANPWLFRRLLFGSPSHLWLFANVLSSYYFTSKLLLVLLSPFQMRTHRLGPWSGATCGSHLGERDLEVRVSWSNLAASRLNNSFI